MSVVYRKEKKYLRYSEWQTHTGAHRKAEWIDDLQMATVFHGPPPHRVQAYMLQDAEALPAKETRLITLEAKP